MAAFRTAYDTVALFAVVAAVARFVNPSSPADLTKPQFDRARAAAGHSDAPKADTICRRVPRLDWRSIVTLALDDSAELEHVVGARLGEADDHLLEREDAIVALKTIAARLDTSVMTPVAYEQARRAVDVGNGGRRHLAETRLPNWNQIVRLFGSPAAALEAAGLTGAVRTRPTVRNGVDWTEALDRCVEMHGALPTSDELAAFAIAQGFALARQRLPFREHVAELTALRAARGEQTPSRLPRSERPDFRAAPGSGQAVPASDGALPARLRRWTREDCVESLVEFLEWLPAGRRASRLAYMEFKRGRPDLPHASVLTRKRHGGFSVLLEDARKLRQARRSSSR